jgi:hypothetical protein
VSIITATSLRRLIPASGVAAVLALSFLAPVPSQASNLNNCGVKGYGYHDHGKVCPNRPFPGNGKGLAKFDATAHAPSGPTGSKVEGLATPSRQSQAVYLPSATVSPVNSTNTRGHGHSNKGHGRGKSH